MIKPQSSDLLQKSFFGPAQKPMGYWGQWGNRANGGLSWGSFDACRVFLLLVFAPLTFLAGDLDQRLSGAIDSHRKMMVLAGGSIEGRRTAGKNRGAGRAA